MHANDDFDRDDETAISLHDTAGGGSASWFKGTGVGALVCGRAVRPDCARKLPAKEPTRYHEPKKGLVVKNEEETGEVPDLLVLLPFGGGNVEGRSLYVGQGFVAHLGNPVG